MEVKINKEIRDYSESMFFGLSLRQFLFALLSVGAAIGIYFGLNPILGLETTSWLCIVGAAPFAAIGFIKYHGMTAEQFVMAFIKSEFLDAKKIPFKATNIYYEALKPHLDKKEREVFEAND